MAIDLHPWTIRRLFEEQLMRVSKESAGKKYAQFMSNAQYISNILYGRYDVRS